MVEDGCQPDRNWVWILANVLWKNEGRYALITKTINLKPSLNHCYLLSNDSSSSLTESMYHLPSYLKVWEEVFILLKEWYLISLICWLNLCLNLSTWYSAIIRLPVTFSSSRSRCVSLSSSSSYPPFSSGISFCHPLLLLLICVFDVCFISYSVMDFSNVFCLIDNRRR